MFPIMPPSLFCIHPIRIALEGIFEHSVGVFARLGSCPQSAPDLHSRTFHSGSTISSSESRYNTQRTAGAVFRPIGSSNRFSCLNSGYTCLSCCRSSCSWDRDPMTRILSASASPLRRLHVSWSKDSWVEPRFRNCFGVMLRLKGHNRDPLPPARMKMFIKECMKIYFAV